MTVGQEETQQHPDLASILTAIVKHLGPVDLPVEVYDGLGPTDLLAMELNPETRILRFELVDPDEVTFDDDDA